MDEFEFYKELYYKELSRRNEILNSLNIPIGIISVSFSFLFYMVTTFKYNLEMFLSLIFVIFCILILFSLILASYYLVKAFDDFPRGYQYSVLPFPAELKKWKTELVEFQKYSQSEFNAEEHFNVYLINNLNKHATHNTYINDKRFELIYISKKYLILGLFFMFISLLPYGYSLFIIN